MKGLKIMDKCTDCKFNTNDFVSHPNCSGCDGKSKFVDKKPIITEYAKGYYQAMVDISTPKKVIQEKYSPSECPTCHKNFSEFEECNDGYYDRAESMIRCPYCGQKLEW